jgi:hypothetical protein
MKLSIKVGGREEAKAGESPTPRVGSLLELRPVAQQQLWFMGTLGSLLAPHMSHDCFCVTSGAFKLHQSKTPHLPVIPALPPGASGFQVS